MDKDCLVRNTTIVGNRFQYVDGSIWKVTAIRTSYLKYRLECIIEGTQCEVGSLTSQVLSRSLWKKV